MGFYVIGVRQILAVQLLHIFYKSLVEQGLELEDHQNHHNNQQYEGPYSAGSEMNVKGWIACTTTRNLDARPPHSQTHHPAARRTP